MPRFNQAFKNVETVLQASGSRGWADVYLVRVYIVGQEDGLIPLTGKTLGEWCPDHRPILTCVEVKNLGFEGMRVEVEVEALLTE